MLNNSNIDNGISMKLSPFSLYIGYLSWAIFIGGVHVHAIKHSSTANFDQVPTTLLHSAILFNKPSARLTLTAVLSMNTVISKWLSSTRSKFRSLWTLCLCSVKHTQRCNQNNIKKISFASIAFEYCGRFDFWEEYIAKKFNDFVDCMNYQSEFLIP